MFIKPKRKTKRCGIINVNEMNVYPKIKKKGLFGRGLEGGVFDTYQINK